MIDDDLNLIDPRRSAELGDVGAPDYTAATVVSADGSTHLVLARRDALGAGGGKYDSDCSDVRRRSRPATHRTARPTSKRSAMTLAVDCAICRTPEPVRGPTTSAASAANAGRRSCAKRTHQHPNPAPKGMP